MEKGGVMEEKPLISVCIVTYQHKDYIGKCLDSILSQKGNFSLEILLHDDASTDGSQEIIRSYQEKYPEILFPILQTENQYSRGKRNITGIFNFPRAKGEFITVIDGDDFYLREDKLEKQMEEQYGENKKKGAEFIANYKKEAGVKTTASGLAYQVLKEGNGATPKATDMVQVNYVGKLIDGTVFDESKGTPAEFRVDQVIKGWTEILQLMKVGEKVKVVIPQELAYGARFAGEKIPPFSTLVFEIELLKVSAASAAQPDSL